MIPDQEITLLTDGGKPRASGDDPTITLKATATGE